MIVVLLLFSGLIRLIALNQSLWLDEAISANLASRYDFWNIIGQFSVNDFHPPLYYLFLNLWAKIFGTSVVSLRLPSVLFSLISIYFVYKIGKLIKNKNFGLIAATILAVNPLFVYYSQEMRMYSMATCFLTISIYNFIKINRANKIKLTNILGFNLASFLSFTSFYGSLFLLLSVGFYFLFKKKFKLFIYTNVGLLIANLVLLPLVITQFNHSRTMLIDVSNWSLVLGNVNIKNVLLIPLKFSIGRISFYPKNLYYLVGGLVSIFIFYLNFRGALKNKKLGYLFLMPLVFGFIFSVFSPLLSYFRFLYLLPIMALLITYNIKKNWQQVIVVVVFGIFSFWYLLNPAFYREDWKSLSSNLNNNQPLYIIESVADPIKYYRKDIIIKDLKSRLPSENEIVVVPFAEAVHGFDHEKKLNELGYKISSKENFREIVLERWKKAAK